MMSRTRLASHHHPPPSQTSATRCVTYTPNTTPSPTTLTASDTRSVTCIARERYGSPFFHDDSEHIDDACSSSPPLLCLGAAALTAVSFTQQ